MVTLARRQLHRRPGSRLVASGPDGIKDIEWSVTKSDVAGVNFAVASGSNIRTGAFRASATSNSAVTATTTKV